MQFVRLDQCCALLLFFTQQGVAIFINSVMLDIDAIMESSNHILLGMCLIFHIYIYIHTVTFDGFGGVPLQLCALF